MYGLKHAGLLANQLLQAHLAPFGYYPTRHTPRLWLLKTRPISFTLFVDDFTIKCVGKKHAYHLKNALLRTYELATDWTATVKLLPLPQPPLRARMDARKSPSAQRATQLMSVLARV
jgi:hypothetical protein